MNESIPLNKEGTDSLDKEQRRRQLSTLGPKGPLIQAGVMLAAAGVAFWLNGRISTQWNVTDGIIQDTRQLNEEVNSTKESSERIESTVSTVSGRLESIEADFESVRDGLQALKQDFTDRRAKMAMSTSNARMIQHQSNDVPALIDHYDKMLRERNSLIEEIWRRHSSEPDAYTDTELALLINLRDTTHPDSEDAWRDAINTLLTPVNAVIAEGDLSVEIPTELVTELQRLKAEVQNRSDALQDDLFSLRAFRERFAAPAPPGMGSLDEVLYDHQLKNAEQRNLKNSDRLAEEQERSDQQIALAGQATINRLKEIKLAGEKALGDLQAEAEELGFSIRIQAARDEIDSQKKAEQRRQEEARLLAAKQERQRQYEASLPEMKRLLVPFFSSGHQQLNGTTWADSPKPAPLSYSGIRASGALESGSAGHQAFMWLAGGPYNDRANGIFPQYIGGSVVGNSSLPAIRRGQFLLQEFGEHLVEDGLLAP